MINFIIKNDSLISLLEIEKYKTILEQTKVPVELSNKFRKNTRKKSSYASNIIEGNPLTYKQAEEAIEIRKKHYLKPEQEIRNYYLALDMLSKELENNTPYSTKLLLKVQKQIVAGEAKSKIGIRGPMAPGVIFGVYNEKGLPDYIPPEYKDIDELLKELENYIHKSDDHPVIKAAILHYQLVTIHPFEDGNGRTARIMSNYLLSYYGYGFKEIGSLEEYFAYDLDEYYSSLQMGLSIFYYNGRNNPPHPEIWINYFLKIFLLYAKKVVSIATESIKEIEEIRLKNLSIKAFRLYDYLKKNNINVFAPIDMSKVFNVTTKTIINWCFELSNNGFTKPNIVKTRITSYTVL